MRLFLGILVGLLGLAIGIVFSEAALESRPRSLPGSSQLDRTEAAGPTRAPVESITTDAPRSNRDQRLLRAVALLPSDDLGAAIGAIRGRVERTGGEPVEGLTIVLRPTGAAPGRREVDLVTDDFETYMTKRVSQHRYVSALFREAVTDSTGRFEFLDLPANRYVVEPDSSKGTFTVSVDARRTTFAEPGSVVRIVAREATRATFDVRGPDGRPVAEARIEGSNGAAAVWRPEAPTLTLPAGDNFFTAIVDGVGESDGVRATLVGGETVGPIRIDVVDRPTLTVRATIPSGARANQVEFYWLECDGDSDPDERALVAEGFRTDGFFGRSGDDTTASVGPRDLVPGWYWVGASRLRDQVEVAAVIELGVEARTVDLSLPPLAARQVVRAHFLGPDGSRLLRSSAELFVNLERGDDNRRRSEHVGSFERQEDGSWLVPVDQTVTDRIASRQLFARIDTAQLGAKRVVVEAQEFTVQFDPVAILEVEVLGGQPGGDYTINLIELGEREMSGGGALEVTAQPGRYQLIVNLDWSAVHEEEVQLVSGRQRVRVQLPRYNSVTLQFADAKYDGEVVYVQGRGPNGDPWWIESRVENGRAVLTGVRPGRQLAAIGEEFMVVEVEHDATLPFESFVPNALEVQSIDDPGGAHRLSPGDLLVAFDGERFEGVTAMQSLVVKHRFKKQIALTIVRAGVERELEIPPDYLFSGQMWLLPARHDTR